MTRPSTNPLDNETFRRAVITKLALMPMACPFAIRDISAEYGVDPEQAFARFYWTYHHDAPLMLQ